LTDTTASELEEKPYVATLRWVAGFTWNGWQPSAVYASGAGTSTMMFKPMKKRQHRSLPWVHDFNPYKAKFVAVLIESEGELPEWNDRSGVLYQANGRLAFKPVAGHERHLGNINGNAIW